jgi:hypothetical protein
MSLSLSRRAVLAALAAAFPLAFAQAQTSATLRAANEFAPAATAHVDGATTLLLQDVEPWGFDSNEQVLGSLGVAYDVVGSKQFSQLSLDGYATLIVASNQPQRFYNRLGKRADVIDAWLRHGARTLEFHAAYQPDNYWTFTLPGQIGVEWDPQYTDRLTWSTDALTQDLPEKMTGDYASHVTFAGPLHVVKSQVLIVTNDGQHKPVMIDYCIGTGRVIATGQTVEYAYSAGWNFGPALTNMIAASTGAPGCPM